MVTWCQRPWLARSLGPSAPYLVSWSLPCLSLSSSPISQGNHLTFDLSNYSISAPYPVLWFLPCLSLSSSPISQGNHLTFLICSLSGVLVIALLVPIIIFNLSRYQFYLLSFSLDWYNHICFLFGVLVIALHVPVNPSNFSWYLFHYLSLYLQWPINQS